jgi:hypothetical protein
MTNGIIGLPEFKELIGYKVSNSIGNGLPSNCQNVYISIQVYYV